MSVVDIAMATYNGEKYLKQQIDSIIYQTFTDWRLFVRDDGSTDNTVSIIKDYARIDSRIELIEDNLGNLRVSRNFEQALNYCTAPYSMFADQDDVWFPSKIEKSLELIKQNENQNKSLLVFTNSILTNEDLSLQIGTLYDKNQSYGLKDFLFANAGYQGASLMFTKTLRDEMLPFLYDVKVHDYHVSLIGFLYGKVLFLKEPQLYYRRHDNSVNPNNKTLVARIRSFVQGDPILYDESMKEYLLKLFNNHKEKFTDYDVDLLNKYFQIIDPKTNKLRRIILINKGKFTLRNSFIFLVLKLFLIKKHT